MPDEHGLLSKADNDSISTGGTSIERTGNMSVATHSARALNGANCPGPVHSNGMCLLEFVVH